MKKKFSMVIGNPPYQDDTTGDNKNFAPPVYNKIMEAAHKVADKTILITPARFLFDAGGTPKDFNRRMLNDPHFKVLEYEPDASKYFKGVDIKGGVAITQYDNTRTFEPIGIFIPHAELRAIHQKVVVDNPNFRPLSEIVFGRTNYRLTEKFIEAHPDAPFLERKRDFLKSNAFEYAADYFFDEKPDDGNEYVQILGLLNNKRFFKWIRRDYILPSDENKNFDTFKIFVPKSNGSGALGEVLSTPLVGSPLVGSTQTFITIGAFDSRAEAEACLVYVKSKFARAMLGILKITQDNPPQTWAKVPLQDFSATSDIDWGEAVDEQLYRKYGLEAAEIDFIERHVKAMD